MSVAIMIHPAPQTELLEYVGGIQVAKVGEFNVDDHFKRNNSCGVQISNIGPNFKAVFKKVTEFKVAEAMLEVYQLARFAKDPEIIEAVGTAYLAQLWRLMKLQPNGESGLLLTNGDVFADERSRRVFFISQNFS